MSEVIEKLKPIKIFLDILFVLISIAAVVLILLIIGFYINIEQAAVIKKCIKTTTIAFVFQEFIRWFIVKNRKQYLRSRIVENIIAFLLLTQLFLQEMALDFLIGIFSNYTIIDISFAYFAFVQLSIFIVFLIKILRHNNVLSKMRIHPGAITAMSFAIIIIIGGLLLMLPKASPIDNPVNVHDAFFTATSAVCVTGLSTVNIAYDYTSLGRFIIICLIQIGGIGVMTLSSFFATLVLGGLSYRMRIMVKDILSEDSLSEVSNVLKKITIFTFAFELIGAVSLYFSLGGGIDFNVKTAITALFHSISAFCNAGFSTFPEGLTSSHVQQNIPFLSTVMFLIFFGGIGYFAFANMFSYILFKNKSFDNRRRLTLTTRTVFITTFILIVIGTISIFLAESFPAEKWMDAGDRLFHSLFLSITSRTAGFNSVNLDGLNHATWFIVIVLMWIGASPGSTGGGIKTTTFAVIVLHFISYIRSKDHIEIFHRQVTSATLEKAKMIFISSVITVSILLFAIVCLQPEMSFEALLFDVVSAISTTGLTLDITYRLIVPSKYILIALMFIGRVGVLSFFLAFFSPKKELKYILPEERIMVG